MSDPTPVNWPALVEQFRRHLTDLTYRTDNPPTGDDLYAEALRRALGFRPANAQDGHRQLPYDTIDGQFGLTTEAEATWVREGNTVIDRHNRATAERERDEARAETRRVYTEAAKDIADHLREWCNDRRIPAKFRREGFLMAADVVDPRVAKDRGGMPLPTSSTTEAA